MKGKKILSVLLVFLLILLTTSCSLKLELDSPNELPIINNTDIEESVSDYTNEDTVNKNQNINLQFKDEYSELLFKHNYLFVGSLNEYGIYTNARQETKINYCDETSQTWKNFDKSNITATPFTKHVTKVSHVKTGYDRIRTLAEAYSIIGSRWYKNPDLLIIIKDSLTFLHENYYYKRYDYDYRAQVNILNQGDNWYTWAIDIPYTLLRILPAIYDELTMEEVNYYVSPILQYANNVNTTEISNLAEASYVKLMCGVMLKDDSLIINTYNEFEKVFVDVTSGNGFYEDGSFVHHNNVAYNGWYGAHMLYPTSLITNVLINSKFKVNLHLEKQKEWINESLLPLMYGDNFHPMVVGRMIEKDYQTRFVMGISALTRYINDKDIESAYVHIIESNPESYVHNEYMISYGYEQLLNKNLCYTKENYYRAYNSISKVVSNYNNISFGISMSSDQIAKYEAINGENGKGWYLGDGATFTYNNVNDYNSDYFKTVNMSRLAGTTVTDVNMVQGGNNTYSTLTSTYIGSKNIQDGIITAFKLNGSTNEVFTGLTANKGYLIYQDKLVCFGNNIKSNIYNAYTIIENILLDGNVYIDNSKINLTTGEYKLNSNYIYIENYGTIYIENIADVYYNITDNGFIEIYYKHGITDSGNYYYILMPNTELNNANSFVNQFELTNNINNNMSIKNGLNGDIINIDFNSDSITIQ